MSAGAEAEVEAPSIEDSGYKGVVSSIAGWGGGEGSTITASEGRHA